MRCAAQSRPGSLGAGRRDAVGGDHAADRWLELLEVMQQGLEEQRRRSRCRTTSTTTPKAAAALNRRLERRQGGAIAPLERITSDKALQMRTLNVVRAHACTTAPKGRRGHLRHDR